MLFESLKANLFQISGCNCSWILWSKLQLSCHESCFLMLLALQCSCQPEVMRILASSLMHISQHHRNPERDLLWPKFSIRKKNFFSTSGSYPSKYTWSNLIWAEYGKKGKNMFLNASNSFPFSKPCLKKKKKKPLLKSLNANRNLSLYMVWSEDGEDVSGLRGEIEFISSNIPCLEP